MLDRWSSSLAVVCLVITGAAAGWIVWRENRPAHAANIPSVVQDFGHQKVVYHIAEAGRGREVGWLGSMLNRYAPLKPGALDMAVVMNGDGIELLRIALHDKLLQECITKLKALGARLLVCHDSLAWRQLDPEKNLCDVQRRYRCGGRGGDRAPGDKGLSVHPALSSAYSRAPSGNLPIGLYIKHCLTLASRRA